MERASLVCMRNLGYTYDGQRTLHEFKKCSPDVRQNILSYLEEFSLCEVIEVNGHEYILVHAGIENFDPNLELECYYPHELLYASPDYGKAYFRDKILVTGHKPTRTIPQNNGSDYIYKGNNHLAIDCGECIGGYLAAICLETGEEFYV